MLSEKGALLLTFDEALVAAAAAGVGGGVRWGMDGWMDEWGCRGRFPGSPPSPESQQARAAEM